MVRKLSMEEKSEIKALLDIGIKQSFIAEKYKTSASTVSRLKLKISETGTVNRKIGSGRKSSLDKWDMIFLENTVRLNPKLGSRKIALILEKQRSKTVSSSTVRRCLTNMGYKGRISCKNPFLSKKNTISRLSWAREKYNWTNEDWKKVIWSDETKINLFGSDGKHYVRRKDGSRLQLKNLTPTVKYGGGSIMLWACFNYHGVGELYIIEGKMDRFMYTRILNTSLKKSLRDLGLQEFIFQQDNDPKHTSKHVTEYFNTKNVNVMDWPSQSPDLNPIENLWHVLKINVSKKNPKNIKHLVEVCKEEWKKLDPNMIKKLVLSMNKRCREVLDAKGGHTSY